MKQYLIINDSDPYVLFKDKYLLFSDREKGIAKLKELGWDFCLNTPSNTLGVLSLQDDGEIKLSWIPIEAKE